MKLPEKFKITLLFAATAVVSALAGAAALAVVFAWHVRPLVPAEHWRNAFVYVNDKAVSAELYKPLWRKQPVFLRISGDGETPLYAGENPEARGNERWFAFTISGENAMAYDLRDGFLRASPYLHCDPRDTDPGTDILLGKVDGGWEKSLCMGYAELANTNISIRISVNMRHINP